VFWQTYGNRVYRAVARLVGAALGSLDFVESVYVRRAVATGEVSFGRSDIDLSVVIRSPLSAPGDIPKMLSLCRRFRLLRRLLPIVGECLVYTPEELERSFRTDPYRASLDRRAIMVVHGTRPRIPPLPIRSEHAVGSLASWFYHYLPAAVRRRSRRNLRKLALEVWNACATAAGEISEPYLTRREVEAAWRSAEPARVRSGLGDPDRALAVICELVADLHGRLRPPLISLRRPLILRIWRRTCVVLPGPGFPLPPEAFQPDSFLCTPEILDFYIHSVSAFSYPILPPEVIELGILPPGCDAFVRSCRPSVDAHLLRSPGFVGKHSAAVGVAGALSRTGQLVGYLARGEIPPRVEKHLDDAFRGPPSSCADYYRRWYARLCEQYQQIWSVLDGLPDYPA
jgi:hypothetical protein